MAFWSSVSARFGDNFLVFYELYNEPHTSDVEVYIHGDATSCGMMEMLAAVRAHTANPVIIAGAKSYAFNGDSLLQLDAVLLNAYSEANVLYNWHPYMGPNQKGDDQKCPQNWEAALVALMNATGRPNIITEFGQVIAALRARARACVCVC